MNISLVNCSTRSLSCVCTNTTNEALFRFIFLWLTYCKLSKLTVEESSKNAFLIQNLTRGFAGAKLQLIFGLAKVFNIIFFVCKRSVL